MNNNNWHVPLDEFSDEQREVIARVYGAATDNYNIFANTKRGTGYFSSTENFNLFSQEITPDEAFKILGPDRLLEPEQGLQGVDWPDGIKYLVQDVVTKVISFRKQYPSVNYRILATRPKPKVKPLTDEQIEAVFMFVDEVKDSRQLSGADTLWLNEFACEIKEREQTGGEL